MNRLVRNVVAKYTEGPGEGPFYKDPPWMDYLMEKQKGEIPVPPSKILMKMIEKSKGKKVEPFNITNPYDYKTPNDKPKDQKDSPPLEKIYPTHPQTNRNKLFEEKGVLEDWYKARRKDWTSDPSEQSPAISLDRKLATSEIVAYYLIDHSPLTILLDDFDEFGQSVKTAASLDYIVHMDYHYKNNLKIQRSQSCNVTWANKANNKEVETGLIKFKVNCPPSPDTHTVIFQFMRPQGRKPVGYNQYPVKVGCTCESFLFYGAQYYAVTGQYMYEPMRRHPVLAPKPQYNYVEHNDKKHPGRGTNFRVCKHILAAYNMVKNWRITKYFKKYPIIAPPSKIINKDVWKDMMKFELTPENFRKRLKTPKPVVPAYFRSRVMNKTLIDWFQNIWIPMDENEKIKTLESLAEHPEEIYFLLAEEAYLNKGKISDRMLDRGYDLIALSVHPENDLEPQQEEMPGVPEEQKEVGKGTGFVVPDSSKAMPDKDTQDLEEEPDVEEQEKEKEIDISTGAPPDKKKKEKKKFEPKKVRGRPRKPSKVKGLE